MDSLETIVVAPAETLVLGRYRLHERLGKGGFGVVWRAHDEQLHREVAVKRIWLNPQGEQQRATREAQATARLSHPAIVALYEAQAEGEAFYLISELVHGETLASLLEGGAGGRRPARAPRFSQSNEEGLTDAEVLALGVALAGALEHAHGRGVIHRDVKPQNILVPDDPVDRAVGVAKLTDFGGARLAGEEVLTRTGDVLGTLAYMPPEQCEGREATAQSDLYSLALVIYEALSGVNPVRGPNPAATARRIGGEHPPLHHYRRDLPRELTEALDEALSPAPEDRGTLPELREVLEEGLADGSGRPRRRRPRRPTATQAHVQPHHVHAQPHHAQFAPSPPHPDAPPYPAQAHPNALSGNARGSFDPSQGPNQNRSPGLRFPRAVWIVLTAGLALWQSLAGRPGVALLAVAAAAPLLLPRRLSPLALTGGLAPALGAVGLAGVFPTVAGQAATWRARAGLGAAGYWWLCLAEPLVGRRLWLGPPAGLVSYPGSRAAWEGSVSATFNDVLVPLLSTGVLLGAALWAAAALLLPWLVRGRSAALDLVAATMWTAALLAAAPLLDHGLPLVAGQSSPRGALPAAILAGALAVGARALRGPV